MELRYAAHSEVGLVRKNNQDAGYASPTMIVVADGMGGAARGDLAAAVAIDEFARVDAPVQGDAMETEFAKAFEAANGKLAALVHADPSLDGMGTTVCGGFFDGQSLGLTHIGDSRAYLVRDGRLRRLTHDHSWVQSLVDEGRISAEAAQYHPHRSLLLKVLNGQPNLRPDQEVIRLAQGDRLLLCSDGLCGLVEDDEIAEIAIGSDLDGALAELVQAAHAGGGLDNITIILADVVPDGEGTHDEPLLLGAATEVEIPAAPERFSQPAAPAAPHRSGRGATAATPSSADDPSLLGDPEDARYRPGRRPRRRRLVALLTALALVVALVAGLAIASAIIKSRYYVGVGPAENVAIFQGTPDAVGPVKLSSVRDTSNVPVADLPQRFQEQVRTNQFTGLSYDSARYIVQQLELKAQACRVQRYTRAQQTTTPSPTASPTPSPTPSPSPTDGPSPSTIASATASPTPTPTPTATPTPPPAEDC